MKTDAPVQRPRNKIGSFAFGCHNWKEMYIGFIVENPKRNDYVFPGYDLDQLCKIVVY